MVKAGRTPVYADPRDGRVKLVKRDELEAALRPVPLAVEAPEGKAATERDLRRTVLTAVASRRAAGV